MTEPEKTQTIQDCQSSSEMVDAFKTIGPVEGSHKQYSPERLAEKLQQLKDIYANNPFDLVPWNNITRTHGIRAKAMEILYYEKRGI